MIQIQEAKDKVQKEARAAYKASGYWGSWYMATGSGKTKPAIDEANEIVDSYRDSPTSFLRQPKILISVPTEKLRDEGWRDEFIKWTGGTIVWNNFVEKTCYASLHTYENEVFDMVILDEGHHITEANSDFFRKNTVRRCLLMTATKPTNHIKIDILKELKLYNPCYTLSLDKAVELGIVAPYEITIVHMALGVTDKYIKVEYLDKKTKQKKFWMQTETERYNYLTRMVENSENPMAKINRMHFIRDLKSKTIVAQLLLENVIPPELRTLIFCGSKSQADTICEYRFYSKPSKPKYPDKPTPRRIETFNKKAYEYKVQISQYQSDTSLKLFQQQLINQLSCVEALNEGQNLEMLNVGFIVQLNAQAKDLIQRMGRLLRIRDGHRGKIIILCVDNTVDEEWINKATMSLDKNNIKHVQLQKLRTLEETISFD